jgi:hypothetical protein
MHFHHLQAALRNSFTTSEMVDSGVNSGLVDI